MDSPLPYILTGIVLTLVCFYALLKLSNMQGFGRNLSFIQKLLFGFIVLYTPAQLIILLAAGHLMPLINPKGHETIAVIFTSAHALMAVMGMVICANLYKQLRPIGILLAMNGVTATFYFLCASIFLLQS